ncbi:MAG: anhydro-N-acetylmuramic acid kinase [Alphaproteobacteria bacterium]
MMDEILNVVGLMSGTSMDGVDAALLRTDGKKFVERLAFISMPYPAQFREELRGVILSQNVTVPFSVLRELTALHYQAVKELLAIYPCPVDVVGFHGHTIKHAPEERFTYQAGDAKWLAEQLNTMVVADFRVADVTAGGQGAPLVPIYHQALAAHQPKPLAMLNIGGVANITFMGSDEELIAFDTGPGIALIDDWIKKKTGNAFDEDGALALKGQAHTALVETWLQHPYFNAPFPKSLDRQAFQHCVPEGLSVEDGAATLACFTAMAVAKGLALLPVLPLSLYVAGGGRLHRGVMKFLQHALPCAVHPAEAIALNGDSVEAEAFAYLAVRSIKGLPFSFPLTTGVPTPLCGGRTYYPYVNS